MELEFVSEKCLSILIDENSFSSQAENDSQKIV